MNDPTTNRTRADSGAEPDFDVVVVGAGFAGLYLLHRLRELGVSQLDEEIERRTNRSLRAFKRRLLALVERKDWEAALFAQNVILETMEFTVFHAHSERTDPVTREVLSGVIKDERRHLGFGENDIGRRLADAPHLRSRLREVKRELDPLVLDTF